MQPARWTLYDELRGEHEAAGEGVEREERLDGFEVGGGFGKVEGWLVVFFFPAIGVGRSILTSLAILSFHGISMSFRSVATLLCRVQRHFR